jgi:hypothetical protein
MVILLNWGPERPGRKLPHAPSAWTDRCRQGGFSTVRNNRAQKPGVLRID